MIEFSKQQIDEIINKYNNGKSMTALSKEYKISITPIKRILNNNDIKIRSNGESRRENLKNKKFGKLLVLDLDPEYVPKSGRHSKWLCQCDCGNIVSVQSNHLKDGSQQACSAKCNHIIPINTKIGSLTVKNATDKRDKINGAIIYECLCDCGETIFVPSTELRSFRKTSCKKCHISYGESKIKELLLKYNIPFEQEKIFNDCKNIETGRHYRFDFYVNNHYIIEFDGEQHFMAIDYFGGDEYLKLCQKRDAEKNKYCKDNNIPIIRIPYTKINELTIQDLLL